MKVTPTMQLVNNSIRRGDAEQDFSEPASIDPLPDLTPDFWPNAIAAVRLAQWAAETWRDYEMREIVEAARPDPGMFDASIFGLEAAESRVHETAHILAVVRRRLALARALVDESRGAMKPPAGVNQKN